MKRFKSIVAVLLMSCMVFAAACGGGKDSGNNETAAQNGGESVGETEGEKTPSGSIDKSRTINIANSTLVDTFYTPKEFGIAEGISYAQVYDTLLVQELDGSIGPSLAEDWEISDDGLTYTFYLRKDVKWQDGEPFTAEDVKFTFDEYQKAPLFAYLYQERVEENILVDDYTFQFKLKAPMASFIANLHVPTVSSIMPKHAYEKYGEEYGSSPETTVGTGPYILTEWQPGVSETFKANPDYFKGTPSIENICMHQISDANGIVDAMQTGDIDLSYVSVSGGNYDTLKAEPKVVLEEYPDATYHSIYMYCKSGLFSDVRVRQAVAYAINKEDVITIAMNGRATALNYLGDIGSMINGNPDIVPDTVYEYDLEKAKALIKDAGVEGADVVISSYNSEPYLSIDTYLQSVLTQIGLNASVQPVERATLLDDLDKETVMIAPLGKADLGMDMEASLFASVGSNYYGTAGNYSFFSDDEIEALGLQGDEESDPEKRKEIYKEMINKIAEQVPYVPLYALQAAMPHSVDIASDNPRSESVFDYHWADE